MFSLDNPPVPSYIPDMPPFYTVDKTYAEKAAKLKELLPTLGVSLFGEWWRTPMTKLLDVHPKSFARWLLYKDGHPPLAFDPDRAAKQIDKAFAQREQELALARQQFSRWANR